MTHTVTRLLTIDDLADILGVTPKAIRRLRDRGRLPPAVKVGRSLRWTAEDIEQWISEQTEDPIPGSGVGA